MDVGSIKTSLPKPKLVYTLPNLSVGVLTAVSSDPRQLASPGAASPIQCDEDARLYWYSTVSTSHFQMAIPILHLSIQYGRKLPDDLKGYGAVSIPKYGYEEEFVKPNKKSFT